VDAAPVTDLHDYPNRDAGIRKVAIDYTLPGLIPNRLR